MTDQTVPEGPTSRTGEHPLIKRLQRQARQFDHATNTATTNAAQNMLRQQHSFIVAIAVLGQHPEKWEEMAAQMVDLNVEMLAAVVSAGIAKLPPTAVDHD